jgi:peptide/nickel transport system substrate-binding protein
VASLTLAPVLAGCLPAPGSGNRLVVAQGADPATLDPLLQTGLVEASVYGNIFEPLLRLDREGQLTPALAESFRSLDSQAWEFKLRSGVTFHNGEPFDSASVRATIERMLDPANGSPIRSQLAAIERVETPNAQTAIVVTRQPFAPLLAELTGLMMLPPRLLAEAGPETISRQPVGTGPFRFVEWIKNERLALEANPSYWRGAPSVRQVVFRAIPESAARITALRNGEADLSTNIPPHLAASLEKEGLRIVRRPGIQTLYVRLHARKPPLEDVRVRRALALAIDVDQVIATVYGGHARRVNGPYPPEVFGYDTSAPAVPYDPDRARLLLREAGLDGGFSLTMQTPRGRYPGDDQIAEILAGYFARIGVRVETQVLEWGAYLAALQAGRGEHLFLLAGTNRTFDPHFTITRLYANSSSFGLHYYGNQRIDGLASEAAATLDPTRRRALYTQILTILRDDTPAIWLAQLDDVYALRPQLTWTPRADSLLWMYSGAIGSA